MEPNLPAYIQSALTLGQSDTELKYRDEGYRPQAEVVNFINHVTQKYFAKQDRETLAVIRRAMGELTNEPLIKLQLSLSTRKEVIQQRDVLSEHYAGKSVQGEGLFQVSLRSCPIPITDQADWVHLEKPCLHRVKRASERAWKTQQGALQFVTIYHQLQNLVSELSGTCSASVQYEPKEEKYYILLRPLDQVLEEAAKKKLNAYVAPDRFQVMIMLQIPPVV